MSELIDRGALKELREFIQGKFPEIVETYTKSSTQYVQAIQKGFKDQDAQVVADAAHPLKSASGTLGLVAMLELCSNIEQAANEVIAGNDSFDSLAPMVGKVGDLFEESAVLLRGELD